MFSSLRRNGEELDIDEYTRLQLDDEVLVIGNVELLLENANQNAREIVHEKDRKVVILIYPLEII